MNHRILIVEDEGIVALDIKSRLEAHGFDVIDIVSTGSRAVEKAASTIPDLILMDISLKGSIDGIETASLIKRHLDCPIIFLTAFADEKTLKKARISDASGYILKPFRESELLITIELAIKRASVKKKIQESSNWFYSTLNNINDAVITVSDEKRVIFFNDRANELMDGNLVPGDIFNDESLIIYNEQRTYFTNGNKKIDIEYTQTDISDENGDVIGIVHFIHDIRKQVEYEIGLENARVEAENSNRAKNDFLANVTHELRTPLNTIMGMNSLISELSQDEEISTMHQLISSAAENLLSQLNDILELSEIERGNITVNASRFSINKVIQEILKSFETQLELKSLSAFVKTEGALPFIVGDKNKIRDIIACLISNAVKFTKKGSITILSSIDVDKLNISIKDTGIGLSEEQKKLIFNDFTQVDGSHTRIYGGNGVGLALVRKLLKLLEGSIVVESDNVTGSEFSITIPIEISEDQKSSLKKIEENVDKKDFFPMDIKSKTYKDLMRLLNEISDLLNNESFDQIDKKIKTYCNIYTISDLNYESQILFRLSVALKLKKKNKIQEIINEVLNESINSTGGIYENSYS